jgi:hypothetical protein
VITSDSVQKYEVEVDVAENGIIELVGRIELAEANENACAAVIVHYAADVQVITFTRAELVVKMYEILAKAAKASRFDGVDAIEKDIDEVRSGRGSLADYTWYFEL